MGDTILTHGDRLNALENRLVNLAEYHIDKSM